MDKSISFDCYQKMADYYYSDVDIKPINADYERPGTLSLLPDLEGMNVLDAGCGAGWYTQWLLKKGATVTALDQSPNMIDATKKRVGEQATIIEADLSRPLHMIETEKYDLIVSSLTLHYIKNWEIPMSEFNRVLRDKGRLVFSVHHPFMDYVQFDCGNYFSTELLADCWNINGESVNVPFYRRPLSEIVKPLYLNGFVIEKIIEPMPTEQYRQKAQESYDQLTKQPQFLFIKAQKMMKL